MSFPPEKNRALRKSRKAKIDRQEAAPENMARKPRVDQPQDEPAQEALQAAEQAAPSVQKLELPKGAMLAVRKSGGLRFSSHEIVVYPDGRVTYGGGDTAKTALESRATRAMTDAQVMKMRRMLDQFFRMQQQPAEQNPDAMVYEIVARVGNKSNQMEVHDGSIPESLQPLIEQMNKLMPSEA